MNIAETAKVLTLAAAVDRRLVDEVTIAAWHDLIGHLDFTDACEAVRVHRRTSVEYLLPAHVVAGVRDIRRARIAASPPPLPGVDPDDVAAYQAARRRLIRAAADSSSSIGRKQIHG